MSKNFVWLLYWKQRQLELNPEANVSISIQTIKNGDWQLLITFEGTELENKIYFNSFLSNAWGAYINLSVDKGKVFATASRQRMLEMLQLFREVCEHCSDINYIVEKLNINDDSIKELLEWHQFKESINHQTTHIAFESTNSCTWKISIHSENIIDRTEVIEKKQY